MSSTQDSDALSVDGAFAFGSERLPSSQMKQTENEAPPPHPKRFTAFRFWAEAGPAPPSLSKRTSSSVAQQLDAGYSQGRGEAKRQRKRARDDPCCVCSSGSTCTVRNCTCAKAGRACTNCDPGKRCKNCAAARRNNASQADLS